MLPYLKMADQDSAQNAENENEDVISMVDYLKEEEELEKDAKAVLGDSDENQCTFSKVNFSFYWTFILFVSHSFYFFTE